MKYEKHNLLLIIIIKNKAMFTCVLWLGEFSFNEYPITIIVDKKHPITLYLINRFLIEKGFHQTNDYKLSIGNFLLKKNFLH